MVNDPETVAAHLTAAIVHSRVVGDRSTMNKTVTVKETVKTYLECLEELTSPKGDKSNEDGKAPEGKPPFSSSDCGDGWLNFANRRAGLSAPPAFRYPGGANRLEARPDYGR